MTITYRGVSFTPKKIAKKKTKFSGLYRGFKFDKVNQKKVKTNQEVFYRGAKVS